MFGTKIDRFTTQDGALDLQLISAIITLMFMFFLLTFFFAVGNVFESKWRSSLDSYLIANVILVVVSFKTIIMARFETFLLFFDLKEISAKKNIIAS